MSDFFLDVSTYDSRRWIWNRGWVNDLPIDWKAGETIGLTCASMKAGEGLNEDPAFAMNWKGAQGRPREAWWFFRQNVNAIQQAKKFLSIIQRDWVASDQATIDWETLDGASGAECLANGGSFIYEVEKVLNKGCGIYTYPGYWLQIGGASATSFKQHQLHLAQWPLDNWIAGLALPPFAFTKDKLADLMGRVSSGNLKPYRLSPWYDDIMAWQFTARAWTKDIPGHPAVKTVADVNMVIKPWWNGGNIPPITPPTPPQPTDYIEYIVTYTRVNVRATGVPTGTWVRYAVKDEVVKMKKPLVRSTAGYLQMTDDTWIFADYVKPK